jgi:hypothetical protein
MMRHALHDHFHDSSAAWADGQLRVVATASVGHVYSAMTPC